MLKNSLKALGFASTLVIASTTIAGEAMSWNLSRDMITGIRKNPAGVWAFMQNNTGVHNPANYTLLPTYSSATSSAPQNRWENLVELGYIGIPTKTFKWVSMGNQITASKGVPHAHPGVNGNSPVLRWKSPISGTVSILGRISDVDPYCGDGIVWSLESGTTVIQSGVVNGNGAVFSAQDLP